MKNCNNRFATTRHRGVAAILAMLFLTLLGTLAVGFYASTTTAIQVAKNDQKRAKALRAAESGVQYMRVLLLAHVSVSSSTDATTMMTELYNDLAAMMNGSVNMESNTVGFASNTITIPSQSGQLIPIDSSDNTGFTITITNVGGATAIVCKVMGMTGAGSSFRDTGVQLTFSREPVATSLFDNAVASKGKIQMSKGTLSGVSGISPNTIATIMSSKASSPALTMSGGTIGGNVGVLDLDYANITGGSVHGTSNVAVMVAQGYLAEVAAPDFPTIDTSVFLPYATNTYSGGSTLSNIVIPPNTNPTFTGNATINGILYVKSPNTIQFRGNTTLAGFIVFENTGTTSQNVIDMRGNFSVANLPAGSQYDSLRAITGVGIIAPTAAITMSGSADSNFRGNVIVGTWANTGSADIMFDNGSLVAMSETASPAVHFNGKTIKWKNTGKNNLPSAGVTYSNCFAPSGGTYLELN